VKPFRAARRLRDFKRRSIHPTGIYEPAHDGIRRIDLSDPFLPQPAVFRVPPVMVGMPAFGQPAVGNFCLLGVGMKVQPQRLKTFSDVGRHHCMHLKKMKNMLLR
jgi:hypothetical protein